MAVRYLDDATATVAIGGGWRPEIVEHYQQQWNQIAPTGFGQMFSNSINQSRELWMSEDAISRQSAALRVIHATNLPDCYRPIVDIDYIQLATPIMREAIMAHPEIRRAYDNMQIEGFGGNFAGADYSLGTDHQVYQSVMNGEMDDDGYCTTYVDVDDMEYGDQLAVQVTWESTLKYIEANDEDPTSPLGNAL